MNERIGHGFAERPLRIVGHAHPQQAHHQLLFAVPSPDAALDLFHHAEQRPAKEVVHLDTCLLYTSDAADE